ncbi:MAG TPA: alpha/beta fold hydrolase [Dehalococcoidia bacterium]|nr:alpha/beta fold hydrolase [Dehalococcoidia bacterium]
MVAEQVKFWSEGTRLAGDLYRPRDDAGDGPRPAIVLCHGWGGTKEHLRNIGLGDKLAAAGYVVLAFDYRGWGESDGKVIVLDDLPAERTETTVRVRVIREVVDPFDELWDVRHAIDYIEGEPDVDVGRIGIWGSSYGGGLVVWTAAHDPRVRCAVSQVGGMDSHSLNATDAREAMHRAAIRQARGEVEPVPQDNDDDARLSGTPHRSKMYYWGPVEFAEEIDVPLLLIDAEHEELFDRHRNSGLVYERMKGAGNAPIEYRVIEGITRYQVYNDRFDEASDLALDWFDRQLK